MSGTILSLSVKDFIAIGVLVMFVIPLYLWVLIYILTFAYWSAKGFALNFVNKQTKGTKVQ